MKPASHPSPNPTFCTKREVGFWVREGVSVLNFLSFHRVTSEEHFYSVVQEGCEQKIFFLWHILSRPHNKCHKILSLFGKGSLQKEILFNAEVTCTTVECVLYTDFELIFACTRIFTTFQPSQKQFYVM